MKPVDFATQSQFYREALGMAFCQPNVTTFLFFHAVDDGSQPLAVGPVLRRRHAEAHRGRGRQPSATPAAA